MNVLRDEIVMRLEVRALPSILNNMEIMKYHLILLSLIMTACKTSHTETVPQNSISIETVYNNRDYELGEAIPVTITVTEEVATGNYFNASFGCTGGSASITIDNNPYTLDEVVPIDYDIINASYSKATFDLNITPQGGESALQNMSIEMRIATANGIMARTEIPIRSINPAPIATKVTVYPTTILINETATVHLTANKDNFYGTFKLQLETSDGKGFFTHNGQSYPSGATLSIKPGVLVELEYNPGTWGDQELLFTVSDDAGLQDKKAIPVMVNGAPGTDNPQNI